MRSFRIVLLFLMLSAQGLASETEKKVFTTTVDPDGVQRVSVSAGEYFFEPNYIIVKVHIPVEMTIRKTSSLPHGIVIDAPEANLKIEETLGQDEKLVRFTPGKTGEYPFYCPKGFLFFKSHREKGMEGVLKVIE